MRKYNIIIFILIISIIGLVAYMFFSNQESSVQIEEIRLNQKSLTIYPGDKYMLILTTVPSNIDTKVIWESNNESVVNVDQNGMITGIGEGETDIVVSTINGKKSDSCRVTVKVREIERIEVQSNTISLSKGQQQEINAVVYPYNATYSDLVYQSSNEGVVTVDNNGTVYAVNDGEAEVIIKDSRGKIEVRIKTIVGIPLESISLNKSEISLSINGIEELKAIFKPENVTAKNVKWSSSNDNVAIVDQNGKVTAKSIGDAIITVTSIDTGKTANCKVKVEKQPNLVQSLTLNKTSVTLDVGKYAELLVTVNPSNADNKEVSWTSSNFDIATVDQNGIVTAKKGGIATITVTSKDGGKTATCEVTVNKKVYDPIVPSSSIQKYEGTSLKYYIQSKNLYYLTYIWMEDPYNQIRKLEANVSEYGSVMTDEELANANKKLIRTSVPVMMNAYISKGIIPKEKAAVGFNASGFYVKGSWNPPDDYYNNRSSSWLVITDGKITRNRMADAKIFSTRMIGISSSGDLKIYDYTYNNNNAQQVYDAVMADKVKNTWDFYPELVRDGKVVVDPSANAKRQAICQIDGNNYVMYTSITTAGFDQVAQVFVNIGCKTAFNLDGGGSTSLFIKKPNSTYATKVKCSDGSTHDKCRSIVEGIYFTEK